MTPLPMWFVRVLSQLKNSSAEKPIGFATRRKAERGHVQMRKEGLAIVFAVKLKEAAGDSAFSDKACQLLRLG